jgi:tRNA dimethylallyltransferase
MDYLDGRLPFNEAVLAAQQGHRNYAKRQLTWFRREPDVHWWSGFGFDPDIQRQCLEWVASNQ